MIAGVLALAAAYALGSLPIGYWAGRARGVDVRRHGSGNTGATNVLRVLGPRVGVPVLLLDMAKGAAAVVVAQAVGGVGLAVLAAVLAVVGHMFPVFLGFGGGKGVATGAGAMIALSPAIGVAVTLGWIAIIAATRYVSLASIAAAVAFPTLAVVFGEPWPVRAFGLVVGTLVVWRHRANIARLRAGTENRISFRTAR